MSNFESRESVKRGRIYRFYAIRSKGAALPDVVEEESDEETENIVTTRRSRKKPTRQCPLCDADTGTLTEGMQGHLFKFHKQGGVACPMEGCDSRVSLPKVWRQHMKGVHKKRAPTEMPVYLGYECTDTSQVTKKPCQEAYESVHEYVQHRNRHHPRNRPQRSDHRSKPPASSSSKAKTDTSVICESCGKVYSARSGLFKHQRVSTTLLQIFSLTAFQGCASCIA